MGISSEGRKMTRGRSKAKGWKRTNTCMFNMDKQNAYGLDFNFFKKGVKLLFKI